MDLKLQLIIFALYNKLCNGNAIIKPGTAELKVLNNPYYRYPLQKIVCAARLSHAWQRDTVRMIFDGW